MKKNYKALLLSAFVLPGFGHFYLKKELLGFMFSGATFVAMALMSYELFLKASHLYDKILAGDVAMDYFAMREILLSSDNNSLWLTISLWSLVIIWLIALIDVYRIVRQY